MRKLMILIVVVFLAAVHSYAVPITVTFQEGVNGYSGTLDTELSEGAPGTLHGDNDSIKIDFAPAGSANHGLLMFSNIFGSGPGQVPTGSDIVVTDVTLTLYVNENESLVDVYFHRMLGGWYETDTWNIWGDGTPPHNSQGGLQDDDYDASSVIDGVIPGPGDMGFVTLDSDGLVDTVQAWCSGDATNYGWALLPGTNNDLGVRFASSEHSTVSYHPLLSVTYIPEPATIFMLGLGAVMLRRKIRK